MVNLYARFESELQVRPDDLDMYQHVHNSRYMDYVLAARYDQMGRCYGLPMEEFLAKGLGWFVREASLRYKRPLGLGDRFLVRTWIESFSSHGVSVGFEIVKKEGGKLSCEGSFDYALIDLASRRAIVLPDWIREHYSQPAAQPRTLPDSPLPSF
jgi:YbgC/YbaW family acyl-CoA thioester hydrolase